MTTENPSGSVENEEIPTSGVIADSPAATGDEGAKPSAPEPSLFDVVEQALASKSKDATATPAAEGEDNGPSEDDEPQPDGAESRTEEPPPPFHKHPRWIEREKAFKDAKAEAEALRPYAERHKALEGYIAAKGLTPQDLDSGFEFIAALKNARGTDAEQALAAILPVVEELQARAGKRLPADLSDEVESGFISEERAAELARLRMERESLAEEQSRRHYEAVVSTVAQEEARWKADPDYEAKAPMIRANIRELRDSYGPPRTPDEAVAMARRAKDMADEYFRSIRPAKKPVKPVVGGTAKVATPTPKSPFEAFEQALKSAR